MSIFANLYTSSTCPLWFHISGFEVPHTCQESQNCKAASDQQLEGRVEAKGLWSLSLRFFNQLHSYFVFLKKKVHFNLLIQGICSASPWWTWRIWWWRCFLRWYIIWIGFWDLGLQCCDTSANQSRQASFQAGCSIGDMVRYPQGPVSEKDSNLIFSKWLCLWRKLLNLPQNRNRPLQCPKRVLCVVKLLWARSMSYLCMLLVKMYQRTIWQQFNDVQYIEKWIVWVAWLSSKVLEALKAPKTEPFAQNSQYKNAFKCEEEKGDDAGAAGRPKDRTNVKKKKRRRGPAQVKEWRTWRCLQPILKHRI